MSLDSMKDLTDEDDDNELIEYAAAIGQRDNITEEIAPGIQIRKSKLHGYGVFCCQPRITRSKRLTTYPSVVVKIRPGDTPWTSQHRPYSIEVIKGKMYLDAYNYGIEDHAHLGHIFNTCHPSLPPPYNKKNVDFFPTAKSSIVHIKTTRNVYYGEELLADYHWYLTTRKLLCTLPVCKECPPEFRRPGWKNKWN